MVSVKVYLLFSLITSRCLHFDSYQKLTLFNYTAVPDIIMLDQIFNSGTRTHHNLTSDVAGNSYNYKICKKKKNSTTYLLFCSHSVTGTVSEEVPNQVHRHCRSRAICVASLLCSFTLRSAIDNNLPLNQGHFTLNVVCLGECTVLEQTFIGK